MKRSRNFACVTLAPSLRSAILLEFLWWAHARSKTVRDDLKWSTHTFEELAARTGLTMTAVRRGMKELIDTGLIIRKRGIRRVQTALSQETNGALTDRATGVAQLDPRCYPEVTNYVHKGSSQTNITAQLGAAAYNSFEKSEEFSGENSEGDSEPMSKTSDILEAHKTKNAAQLDPDNFEGLIASAMSKAEILEVFRSAWLIGGAPPPVRKIAEKESGQMDQLGNWLHSEPEAEGITTARIVGHCVSRWPVFRKYLSEHTGFALKNVSPTPEIGLLLYRKEHALRFVKAELAHAHAPKKAGFKTAGDFLG